MLPVIVPPARGSPPRPDKVILCGLVAPMCVLKSEAKANPTSDIVLFSHLLLEELYCSNSLSAKDANVTSSISAKVFSKATAAFTKAVVAICVVSVPALAVGAVGVPVRAGLAKGAFKAIELVTVVENEASSFKAAANSLSVSSAAGAESIRLLTAVVT